MSVPHYQLTLKSYCHHDTETCVRCFLILVNSVDSKCTCIRDYEKKDRIIDSAVVKNSICDVYNIHGIKSSSNFIHKIDKVKVDSNYLPFSFVCSQCVDVFRKHYSNLLTISCVKCICRRHFDTILVSACVNCIGLHEFLTYSISYNINGIISIQLFCFYLFNLVSWSS